MTLTLGEKFEGRIEHCRLCRDNHGHWFRWVWRSSDRQRQHVGRLLTRWCAKGTSAISLILLGSMPCKPTHGRAHTRRCRCNPHRFCLRYWHRVG